MGLGRTSTALTYITGVAIDQVGHGRSDGGLEVHFSIQSTEFFRHARPNTLHHFFRNRCCGRQIENVVGIQGRDHGFLAGRSYVVGAFHGA